MADIARQIKEGRVRKHMRQREVAAMLGRTRATVSAWERGKAKPRLEEWLKLVKLLGLGGK